MSEFTYRQQADAIKLVGEEKAAHEQNLRRSGKREIEAELVKHRLPVLREAFKTLDNLAKDSGQ